MTEVVHFNDVKDHWNVRAGGWDSPFFEYIGRAVTEYHLPQSPWANPFKLHTESAAARTSVLDQYHRWLTMTDAGKKQLKHLPKLRNKTLVCWCKDKAHPDRACHGDVLIELLGEKVRSDQAQQRTLDGVQAEKLPLLLWDNGSAGYQIGMDKHGRLYRTSEMKPAWGVPGKAYTTLEEWTRDWIKATLRVHGCAPLSGMTQREYVCYRYETRLKGLEGRNDERSKMEREILGELIAELEG